MIGQISELSIVNSPLGYGLEREMTDDSAVRFELCDRHNSRPAEGAVDAAERPLDITAADICHRLNVATALLSLRAIHLYAISRTHALAWAECSGADLAD